MNSGNLIEDFLSGKVDDSEFEEELIRRAEEFSLYPLIKVNILSFDKNRETLSFEASFKSSPSIVLDFYKNKNGEWIFESNYKN